MKVFGYLFVFSQATALNVHRNEEEPLKPCKGKEVTAKGKMWECDGTSLEDCANSYTSSGQNTFYQCAVSGANCLTVGPQCKVASGASSCKALYDSGVKTDGAYTISLTTPAGTIKKKLYCDMKNGGWTLIGQVSGKAAMYDGWLRAFKNEQNLETPQIASATWASIPAIDLAVNHATQVRFSNEDVSKWVKWEMDTSRTVETWWNNGDGKNAIQKAADHAVKAYNQDGGSSNCYQNKYGIMQWSSHGGSYPSTQLNGAGNTSPNDNCMSVGVQPSGTHHGFSQNGNGYDQPDSNSDWPNGDYRSPPFVNVWAGGADAAPIVG